MPEHMPQSRPSESAKDQKINVKDLLQRADTNFNFAMGNALEVNALAIGQQES